MNEGGFRRGLQRVRLLAELVPLAAFSVACGGTSMAEGPNDHGGGTAGSGATSGAGGDTAGSAGAATAGVGGGTGGSTGMGGAAGSGASAGMGGASAGMGGASGGMGLAGYAGNSAACHARPAQPCAGGPIELPKGCVAEALASVGTALPLATCQAMCEAMFVTFSCTISAVQQTTITIQCANGCPASRE